MSIEVHTAQTLQALNPTAKTEGGEAAAQAGKDAPQSSAPAQQAEQKETEDSETTETEVEEETEELVEADTKDGAAKTGDEANAQPKRKGGIQKRVDKLNKRVTAAQQETEYWKAEALKNATASKQAPVDQAKPESSEGKPKPEAFDTHSEYVEALTDWKTEQKFKEHDQKLEQSKLLSAQAKANETHAERVKAFAEKTPDFQETLESLEDVPSSPAVREVIITSENGPELLYELAKNPDEAKRIALLGPLAAAREMGKIEARLSSSKTSEQKQDPKKISQAPKPLAPVGGAGKATTPMTLEEAAKSSYADYKKRRLADLKKRRQA